MRTSAAFWVNALPRIILCMRRLELPASLLYKASMVTTVHIWKGYCWQQGWPKEGGKKSRYLPSPGDEWVAGPIPSRYRTGDSSFEGGEKNTMWKGHSGTQRERREFRERSSLTAAATLKVFKAHVGAPNRGVTWRTFIGGRWSLSLYGSCGTY